MATYTENETQTQTETRFDFNRTSQLDNQLDFSNAVPYTGFSPYQTQTQEEEVEEQTPTYEVEKEYKINGLQEDEEIVPTFMPTVNSTQPESVAPTDFKIKLNARGKIIASVFSIVACCLIAFMIYNAVVISKLTNNLNYLEMERATNASVVSNLQSNHERLTSNTHLSDEAGSLGLNYSPESADMTISLPARPEISEPQKSTNWFNSLCEFFSNLFN